MKKENWEQKFIRENPIKWMIMQKIGSFIWFYIKFQICMLLYFQVVRWI